MFPFKGVIELKSSLKVFTQIKSISEFNKMKSRVEKCVKSSYQKRVFFTVKYGYSIDTGIDVSERRINWQVEIEILLINIINQNEINL
jgi:hypothetical protein